MTVKELAKLCGVSPGTVSNVLNGKNNVSDATRKKILKIVEETDYHPNYFASSIRKKETQIIGIITEDLNQFTTPPVVDALTERIESKGYHTILMNMRIYSRLKQNEWNRSEKISGFLQPILRELQSIKVDGIVYVGAHDRELTIFPENHTIPTVFTYATPKGDRFISVNIADEDGGYDMTKYLMSMGHTRIGVITGAGNNRHSINRLQGYKKALNEGGIRFDPELIEEGDWTMESGYVAGKILDKGVTAIWAMNDDMAAGVYRVLEERGLKAGKDISVAGFDDRFGNRYLIPSITTDELPLTEMGIKSAEMILKAVRGEQPEQRHFLIPCKMKKRESVTENKQIRRSPA